MLFKKPKKRRIYALLENKEGEKMVICTKKEDYLFTSLWKIIKFVFCHQWQIITLHEIGRRRDCDLDHYNFLISKITNKEFTII